MSYYRRALALEQRGGDRANEAITHNCLGLLHQQLGDQQRAMDHYRDGLEHARIVVDDGRLAGTRVMTSAES